MRRAYKKNAKLNNAGMTLVEILVAIAILSVAIIPLMFAFVNSMRYNARGRELQQTTALAHTIIENCKADTMQEVIDDIDYGTFLNGVSGLDLSGLDNNGDGKVSPDELSSPYTFYLQNVPLENQKYDVTLTFESHEINGAASNEIMRSITMNPYMDAMLTVHTEDDPTLADPMTPAEMDSHAYLLALDDIASGIKSASQSDLELQPLAIEVELDTSFIEDTFKTGGSHAGRFTLKRNTIISIGLDASGNETVTVQFMYSYEVSGGDYLYTYTDAALGLDVDLYYAAGGDLGTYSFQIYSNSDTKAKGAFLENVYIMYYPAYSKSTGLSIYPFDIKEEFLINNNLPVPVGGTRAVNVYLVKQKNSNYTDSNMITLETDYASKVKVTGSSTTGAKTNLYHNFDYNLGNDSLIAGWAPAELWTGVELKSSMITKESKTLMYDFVVQIYKSGAIDTSGSTPTLNSDAQLILTMDGTDLDW